MIMRLLGVPAMLFDGAMMFVMAVCVVALASRMIRYILGRDKPTLEPYEVAEVDDWRWMPVIRPPSDPEALIQCKRCFKVTRLGLAAAPNNIAKCPICGGSEFNNPAPEFPQPMLDLPPGCVPQDWKHTSHDALIAMLEGVGDLGWRKHLIKQIRRYGISHNQRAFLTRVADSIIDERTSPERPTDEGYPV